MEVYVVLELTSLDRDIEVVGTFSTKEKVEEFIQGRKGYHYYVVWSRVDDPSAEPDEEVC